jgi:hypothetical protein
MSRHLVSTVKAGAERAGPGPEERRGIKQQESSNRISRTATDRTRGEPERERGLSLSGGICSPSGRTDLPPGSTQPGEGGEECGGEPEGEEVGAEDPGGSACGKAALGEGGLQGSGEE